MTFVRAPNPKNPLNQHVRKEIHTESCNMWCVRSSYATQHRWTPQSDSIDSPTRRDSAYQCMRLTEEQYVSGTDGWPQRSSFGVRRHPSNQRCSCLISENWDWCENHPNFESTWLNFHVYWGCCCMTKSRNVNREGLISFTVPRNRLFMC